MKDEKIPNNAEKYPRPLQTPYAQTTHTHSMYLQSTYNPMQPNHARVWYHRYQYPQAPNVAPPSAVRTNRTTAQAFRFKDSLRPP